MTRLAAVALPAPELECPRCKRMTPARTSTWHPAGVLGVRRDHRCAHCAHWFTSLQHPEIGAILAIDGVPGWAVWIAKLVLDAGRWIGRRR